MFQKAYVQTSREFLYMLPVAAARPSSDDKAMRYVLPVLWMTSRFHRLDQIQIEDWSLQYSELLTITRQLAPLNCAAGAKSAIADRLDVNSTQRQSETATFALSAGTFRAETRPIRTACSAVDRRPTPRRRP